MSLPTSFFGRPGAGVSGLLAIVAGILHGCATSDITPATQSRPFAWVQMTADGSAVARAAVDGACPTINIDGSAQPMSLRAPAGTAPLRPSASAPDGKPAAFPLSVCEATLPATARKVSLNDHALPLPKPAPRRIIVLGDSGCRMKLGAPYQACNDPIAWPFASVAAMAARFAPDLVIHVGDYHYRENPCPPGHAGCSGSPWGYGWDAWQADFFQPAAPLLARAPWVFLRGNHEECRRAGQGWFRFLDPHPYQPGRSCDDPARDADADHSEPYALALDATTQLIVFDSARAGMRPLTSADARFGVYRRQMQTVAALAARPGMHTTVFASHHPVLAFNPEPGDPRPTGNLAMQSVLASLHGQAYYPPGIQLALHGHAHSFQALSFASPHPAAIVSGNGGDNVDEALPDPLPPTLVPAPGTRIAGIAHHLRFGFLVMERGEGAAAPWNFKSYDGDGKLLVSCTQDGRHLPCDRNGRVAP
jgi:hypothetical protein